MCNYGGLHIQIHGKSSLQIIYTYRRTSYSGHVSDALGKTKETIIKQLLSKQKDQILFAYLVQLNS